MSFNLITAPSIFQGLVWWYGPFMMYLLNRYIRVLFSHFRAVVVGWRLHRCSCFVIFQVPVSLSWQPVFCCRVSRSNVRIAFDRFWHWHIPSHRGSGIDILHSGPWFSRQCHTRFYGCRWVRRSRETSWWCVAGHLRNSLFKRQWQVQKRQLFSNIWIDWMKANTQLPDILFRMLRPSSTSKVRFPFGATPSMHRFGPGKMSQCNLWFPAPFMQLFTILPQNKSIRYNTSHSVQQYQEQRKSGIVGIWSFHTQVSGWYISKNAFLVLDLLGSRAQIFRRQVLPVATPRSMFQSLTQICSMTLCSSAQTFWRTNH